MSVVILSADSYCNGEELSRKAAAELGYDWIGRRQLLAEAARRFGTTEEKMKEAFRDTFFLGKFSSARNRHLAYFQAVFTEALNRDGVLYYGRMGHLFVDGVSHILKVRLTADLEDRVRIKAARKQISEKSARESLQREMERRAKWSTALFDVDGTDPSLFDLVIDLSRTPAEEAVRRIAETARDVRFVPITYSRKCMADQALASRIRAALIDDYPDVVVRARDGDVTVQSKALKKEKGEKLQSLRERIEAMEGVRYLEIG